MEQRLCLWGRERTASGVSGTTVLFVGKGMRRTRTSGGLTTTSAVFVREGEYPAWKVSRTVQCGVRVSRINRLDVQY